MSGTVRPSSVTIDRRSVLLGGSAILAAPAIGAAIAPDGILSPADALAQAFDRPPHEAGLGTYWYWLDGAVTRIGITADLEAMHANGVTTAMVFTIGAAKTPSLVDPPANALTPHWWSLVDHAVAEADRLGMSISMNICDGWATASGPWITPAQSMQVVTWSEARVGDGRPVPRLVVPLHQRAYYRDTAVLAFPWLDALDADSVKLMATVTTDLPLAGAALAGLIDPANKATIFDTEQGGHIDITFDAPFTLRSVTVRTPSPWGYSPGVYRAANSLEVLASDDGVTFRPVGALEYPQHGWQTDLTTLTHAVPEMKARIFRFVHHPHAPAAYQENFDFGQDMRLRIFSLVLSSRPELHQIVGKTGAQWSASRRTSPQDIPDAVCVDPATVLDLTAKLRSDGTLDWTPPPGRWRILRIGSTTNGRENSAAGGAQGLEVDRFNRAAVTTQFDRWFGAALDHVGPDRAGRVLDTIHVDSWEASGQNWSPNFLAQFRALRGYDLAPWLPVMTGVPMVSAEASEAVLYDIRRTIADLTQTEFFQTVARLAQARGCRFSGEPASPTYAVDGLRWAEATDVPMGEFWLRTPRNDKPTDVADAVSGGHVYGKRVIATESFTENDIRWDEHPAMLKPLGDRHYCRGINRFMLHVYTAQPFMDRAPGMTLNGIGTMFSRTQTWWRQAAGWFTYMRRCQAVLQLGRPSVDVAVFIGEDIPSRALLPEQLDTPLPAGFKFDSINRDALVRLARVEVGDIVLASGARYRVLILPSRARYSSAFLAAIERLIKAGATVLGAPPLGAIGRERDPVAFSRVSAQLWGRDSKQGESRLGQGRLLWGSTATAALARLNAEPDLVATSEAIDWTHRSGEGWDAWFVVNVSDRALATEVSLRATGGSVEIWNPLDGSRAVAPTWRAHDGRVEVPLDLPTNGSAIIVVRTGPHAPHIEVATLPAEMSLEAHAVGVMLSARTAGTGLLRLSDGRNLGPSLPAPPASIELAGPWTLGFSGWRAPDWKLTLPRLVAWSTLPTPAIRFHSGSGHYATTIEIDYALLRPDLRIMLDLGVVREIAEVLVGGRSVATLWSPPFRVDITDMLKSGRNRIEIVVTNVWHNRLVGDRNLPEAERVTWVYPKLRASKEWLPAGDAPLIPAGLIGPVRLVPETVVRIPLA